MIWTKGSTGPEVVKRVIQVIGSLAMFPNDHGFIRRIAYVETKDGLLGGALLGGIWRVSREMLIDDYFCLTTHVQFQRLWNIRLTTGR